MTLLKETELFKSPVIVTELSDDVSVGRMILPASQIVRWEATNVYLRFFNALNVKESAVDFKPENLRRSLLFYLNNNTPNSNPVIAHERPVSAYFTYNPNDETVIVEWGTINPFTRQAKLHVYLNSVIDYTERVKQGMKLSSGHIAQIVGEENMYLALLDNLPSRKMHISRNEPMGKLINTLHHFGFIPIAADGSMRWPAF